MSNLYSLATQEVSGYGVNAESTHKLQVGVGKLRGDTTVNSCVSDLSAIGDLMMVGNF